MAGNLSDYAELQCAKWLFSTASITRPTSWYVALYTTAPDDTGGGTEVSGGGYARQAVTFAEASAILANNAQISFDATGADFGTVIAVGIFDAATAGNLLAWKTVPAQSVVNGQSARFASGALTARCD